MSKSVLISHSSTNVSSPPIRHLLYGKRNFILYHFMAMLHTKRITPILSPFFYTTIIIALNFEIFHLENQPSNKKNSTENSAATKNKSQAVLFKNISFQTLVERVIRTFYALSYSNKKRFRRLKVSRRGVVLPRKMDRLYKHAMES